jgi:rhodanese-related sulfurtransferase
MRLLLLLRVLLAVCLIAAAILAARYSRRIRPITYIARTADTPPDDPSYFLSFTTAALFNPRNLAVVDPSSVTLVLFCRSTYSSIRAISNLVTSHQVMVVCPSSAASAAIASVRSALPHTNVTAHTQEKPGGFFSLMQAACEAPTPWVVLLGHNFDRFATSFAALLHPYDIPVALGVYGVPLRESSHHRFLRPALFAEPPFAIKRDTLCQALQGLPNGIDPSLALGIRLLGLSALGYGALLLPKGEHIKPTPGKWTRQVHNIVRRISRGEIESITYMVIFPDLVSILAFQRTICRIASYGHTIHLLLHSLRHPPSHSAWLMTGICRLRYSASNSLTSVLQWSQSLSPDVVITLPFPDQSSSLLPVLLRHTHPMAQILSLSPSDILNSEWFAALTLQEWKRRFRFSRYLWCTYTHST